MAGEHLIFGVPRDTLVKSGIIPPENETAGKATFIPISSISELLHFIRAAHGKPETGGGFYRERSGAETDPAFQQISMYGFIMKDGQLLTYHRGHANEEPRLDRRKIAIGVGGHMEQDDTNFIQSFYREIAEEVEILKDGEKIKISNGTGVDIKHFKELVTLIPVGIIKDERDEVGRMHIGVAVRVEPKAPNIDIRVSMDNGESSVSATFIDPKELFAKSKSGQAKVEGWGEIVLEHAILPFIAA
jgi:predicted NUDIX family phosphoesterase